jgi:hypothetical protein
MGLDDDDDAVVGGCGFVLLVAIALVVLGCAGGLSLRLFHWAAGQ